MTQEIFNVVRSTLTAQGHTYRMKHVLHRIKEYKHNLTYTKKESLFTLTAIVFVVMPLTVLQAPLVLIDSLLLNFLQSLSQLSLDQTCLTCPIIPPNNTQLMVVSQRTITFKGFTIASYTNNTPTQ